MEIYTVSLFGHREIDYPFEAVERLEELVTDLCLRKKYVEFLIGRDGEFDRIAASVIRRITKDFAFGNTALTLVLPYMKAEYRENMESFHEYYTNVEICEASANSHFKAAIRIRNHDMIDRSDLVACWIEHNSGGAYEAMRYAQKKKIKCIDLNVEIDPL